VVFSIQTWGDFMMEIQWSCYRLNQKMGDPVKAPKNFFLSSNKSSISWISAADKVQIPASAIYTTFFGEIAPAMAEVVDKVLHESLQKT
jgi:hypothetical protein